MVIEPVDSMTPQERSNPELLDKSQSRKNRIAKGSGQSLQEVSRMIKQFEQTRKMMKNVAGAKLPGLGSMMMRR